MPSGSSKSYGTYVALAAGAAAVTYAGTYGYKSRIERHYNDGIDLNNQTVEIDPIEHIRRCTFYKDIDIYTHHKTICPNVQTLGDVFINGYRLSNNGPCIAYVDLANEASPLHWTSYGIALERIRFIGSHLWTDLRLTPMKSVVAIISVNRPEYSFVENACYNYGFIVLALYTPYSTETILSVLEKTQAEVLVIDELERIQGYKDQLLEKKFLKEILVMDPVDSVENEKIKNIPTILRTMQQSDVRPRPEVDPDSVATFILTSGTTGS